jgi:hypothetical protein
VTRAAASFQERAMAQVNPNTETEQRRRKAQRRKPFAVAGAAPEADEAPSREQLEAIAFLRLPLFKAAPRSKVTKWKLFRDRAVARLWLHDKGGGTLHEYLLTPVEHHTVDKNGSWIISTTDAALAEATAEVPA